MPKRKSIAKSKTDPTAIDEPDTPTPIPKPGENNTTSDIKTTPEIVHANVITAAVTTTMTTIPTPTPTVVVTQKKKITRKSLTTKIEPPEITTSNENKAPITAPTIAIETKSEQPNKDTQLNTNNSISNNNITTTSSTPNVDSNGTIADENDESISADTLSERDRKKKPS